ncbi:esterase family protein [Mucilaginibacter conchicola]|uniref:Esterase family protein n=1 Tax=Mucilaginibacter conchicola TaxID=2303333 RepID=A0A372P0A2_9SPHI|nr:alpha/beta hydrolase-fold protein [Mucilaginibacter conchicola]RFZ95554.1 esterase family protein [Mucilaginibacter conchicola]
MKKLSLMLLMLCPALLFAQTGKVYDNLTLNSKILKSERKYAVYLPPDYETSGRSYPILYLLHGAGDDQTGWVQFGEVLNITDKAIRDGIATPMIIVMPDANTGRRGYFNDIKGDWNYEDFFFKELMPFVEKKYKVKTDRRYRAIAGLSMGGGGSFVYALHHPELFSSACPLSAATGFLSLDDAKVAISKNTPGLADSTVSNFYNRYSVIPLMNAMPDAKKKDVRWYIDCGDDDFLYEGNGLVHNLMRKKEIPHEYRIRDGAHNWTYWRASLPSVLEFVTQGFHQY